MGVWRSGEAPQGETRSPWGRTLRRTLIGVAVIMVLLAPHSDAAPGPQDDGIFGTSASVTEAAAVQPGFQDTVAFSGLTQPVAVRFASDGRIFVAEKGGRIKVFDSFTDTTPDLFADLSTSVHDFWDRGLLGFALDPRLTTDRPYVYALYAYDQSGTFGDGCPNPPGATGDGCVVSGRLVRLTAS